LASGRAKRCIFSLRLQLEGDPGHRAQGSPLPSGTGPRGAKLCGYWPARVPARESWGWKTTRAAEVSDGSAQTRARRIPAGSSTPTTNEESFFVRHAYFLGANDPCSALKTTLKAEINEEAWATLHSDTSRPFPKPKGRPRRCEGHQPSRRRGDESVQGLGPSPP